MTRSPLLRILFWALLALSLMGNAVAIGVAWRVADLRQTLSGEVGAQALPREVRRDLIREFRDRRPEFQAALEALGTARQGMFEAAAARPFDRAAVEAAMADVREASAALQRQGQAVLLETLERGARN